MIQTKPTAAHRIPSVLNMGIIAAQLTALAACFWAAAHTHHWGLILTLAIAFGILMNSVYSIIHEAEHAMLFPNRSANEIAGVLMALFFPAPFHLLRQGHIGHHLRNRSDDEAFDLYFEGESPVWKWAQWIGILTGLFYLAIVVGNVVVLFLPFVLRSRWFGFDRPSAAFMDSLN